MRHRLLKNALVLGLAVPLVPQPALANAKQQETCRETGNIVYTALVLRAQGTKANRTKKSLKEGKNQVGKRFVPTVDPLVDWVYSLDKNAVSHPEAPKIISGNWRKDCLAAYKQKG